MKKNLVLSFMVIGLTLNAFAEDVVYTADKQWSGHDLISNDQAPLAVKFSALSEALSQCHDAGVKFCLFKSAITTHLSYNYCNATAVVIGTDIGTAGRVYEEEKSVTGTTGEGYRMATFAANFRAIDAAISKCFGAGNRECAVLSVEVTASSMSEIRSMAKVQAVSGSH